MAKQWIQTGFGFWLVISPWILGFAEITVAKWSSVLIGLVLIVLNGWEILESAEKGRKTV